MKTDAELTAIFRNELRNNGYLHPEPYEWYRGEPLYHGEPRHWSKGETYAISMTIAASLGSRYGTIVPGPEISDGMDCYGSLQ
jgi:hypothetical protein